MAGVVSQLVSELVGAVFPIALPHQLTDSLVRMCSSMEENGVNFACPKHFDQQHIAAVKGLNRISNGQRPWRFRFFR